MARLRNLWRNLVHRSRVERDLDDELLASLEWLVEEKVRSGMGPDQARRAARRELGSLDSLKEEVRDVRLGAGLEVLLRDARHALRLLRRAPGFAAVAVLTLALGIGVNAAIFGVVKSVLLDALPYADADRLVRVQAHLVDGAQGRVPMTARMVDSIAARQQSFDSLVAFASVRDAVLGGDEFPRITRIAWVEPRLFQTLGVPAALGRTFRDEDRALGYVAASGAESGPDTARVVLVTHAAWHALFAGDPGVIGRDVRINGLPRTVIGVLPHGFVGPMGPADFFLAFDLAPALGTGAGWLGLVGRLKADVPVNDAEREVARLWASREGASAVERIATSVLPLRDALVGDTREPLLVLLGSAGLVLLVACANLAGALLTRGLSRRGEFALRVALGAGRRRLITQLLTESAVLALAGGAAGLLAAQVLLSLLRGVATQVLPAHVEPKLDWSVFLLTGAMALATGLLFGIVPALSIARSEARGQLRTEARGASEETRTRRARGVLVAGQMALCVSLLAGAGLLLRSLREMATAPLGFKSAGVLTAKFRLSGTEYPTIESRAQFHERLLERLRSLPGVEQAAIAHKIPTVDIRGASFTLEGAAPAPAQPVLHGSVSDDYFQTLGIPLRQGRTFDSADREGGSPTVVISEGMARRVWPGGDAIGARIRLDGDLVTIVGIVGDVRNDVARADAEPMVYRSHRQESTWRFCVLLRTRADPMGLVRPLQSVVAALDPTLPVQEPMRLEDAVGEGLASRRLPALLLAGFGALALLLASLGVYGMFAGLAAAREREFGVRMALGSPPAGIAGLLLRQGAAWMIAGLSAGALGVCAVVHLVRGWLYAVPPFDPIALGGALAMLAGCAAVALLVPLRRAMQVDPVVALRAE